MRGIVALRKGIANWLEGLDIFGEALIKFPLPKGEGGNLSPPEREEIYTTFREFNRVAFSSSHPTCA
jgi:hypothetical protein